MWLVSWPVRRGPGLSTPLARDPVPAVGEDCPHMQRDDRANDHHSQNSVQDNYEQQRASLGLDCIAGPSSEEAVG